MNTAFAFDSRTGVLKLSLFGDFNAESLFAIVSICRRLSTQIQPEAVIYDCGGIAEMRVEAASVDSLASVRPVFSPEIPEVILAPHEYLFGIARMYQQMAAERRPKIHVVRSWPEAYQALGLTAPPRYAELPVA